MRFVIGPCFPFCVLDVVAALLPGLSDRLLGRHARLRRPPPRRRARAALAWPRTPAGSAR